MARIALILLALVASIATPVFADDWIAQKLRGKVLVLVDGAWQPLSRGEAVPDGRVVRTLGFTRVQFQRGTETVELGPDTQVAFFERASDGFTTVKQYFGEVKVEADIENVRHFAVQAPQLVAVVKGTIFVVRSDKNGASVEVKRGAVAVTSAADRSSVTVRAGQEASSGDSGTLTVSGTGTLPTVVDAKGNTLETTVDSGEDGTSEGKGKSSEKSGKDKSGNGKSGDHKSGQDGSDDDEESDNGNSGNGGNGNKGKDHPNRGGGHDDEDD